MHINERTDVKLALIDENSLYIMIMLSQRHCKIKDIKGYNSQLPPCLWLTPHIVP